MFFYHVSTIAKTPTAAAGDWQLSLDLPGLHQGQPRAHGGGKNAGITPVMMTTYVGFHEISYKVGPPR